MSFDFQKNCSDDINLSYYVKVVPSIESFGIHRYTHTEISINMYSRTGMYTTTGNYI